MIKFAHLTPSDRELLANSIFAQWRAAQIPSNWRALIGAHPAVLRSDSEPPMPAGKRMERGA